MTTTRSGEVGPPAFTPRQDAPGDLAGPSLHSPTTPLDESAWGGRRPRLLDLFCGPGGAAIGYYRAGFEVVGVDIEEQPTYPYEFHRADALDFPLDGFAVVHASPPCELYSASHRLNKQEAPDLLGPIRDRLKTWGGLYVIENVPGAPIRAQTLLCGTSFGLRVHRHRYFECNVPLLLTLMCNGASTKKGEALSYFGRSQASGGSEGAVSERVWALAAGVPWSGKERTRKAIPPAYTEWIGRQVLAALRAEEVA